jgi:dephospho-CoA kinase
MFLVGLTGNYGMGKSTVLSLFRKLGALTFDTDEIVGTLLTERDVLEKIRGLLGERVFSEDGNLRKEKVAELVFGNEALRRSLEDILHPLVFEKIDRLAASSGKANIIVIEVPLLFERKYEKRFNRTVTIYTDQEKALERLVKKGIRRSSALQRLTVQMPVEEKRKRSDFVIDNGGDLDATMQQVQTIYDKLIHEANDGNHHRA